MRTSYQAKLSIHRDKYGSPICLDVSFYLSIGKFLLIL